MLKDAASAAIYGARAAFGVILVTTKKAKKGDGFHVAEYSFLCTFFSMNKNRMTMRSFASDNNSGVHPLVMEALNQANQDHAVGYGDDAWTEEAVRKIREAFTPDCEPLFVFNGTGSNAVALQLCTRSYNSIYVRKLRIFM